MSGRDAAPLVATLVVGAITVAAVIASNGSIAAGLAPTVAVAVFAAMCVLPVRTTLLVLFFLGLALDTPHDADGMWQSPVAPLGRLLMDNLNKTIPIETLRISVLALLLGWLLVVHLARRGRRASAWSGTPRGAATLHAVSIALLALAGLAVYGKLRGGDVQMMNLEAQAFVLTAVVAYLVAGSFHGRRDAYLLAVVVVSAACIKAAMAVWVRQTVAMPDGTPLLYTTTHGDSILFATAIALIVAAVYQRLPGTRSRWGLGAALVLLVAGVVANNRRMAWVEIAATFVTFYAIAPWTPGKRRLTRSCIAAVPLLLLYGAIGWTSSSSLFAPVRVVRSIQDSKTDGSTMDRDVENYNLVSTFSQNRILGTGLGQPYDEIIRGDDISHLFAAYRFVPHNSVLWLWAAGGLIGFTAIWMAFSVPLYVAARAFRLTVSAERRALCLVIIAVLEVFVLQCWGDMGFGEPKAIFLVGAAWGLAAQLSQAVVSAHALRAAA